MSRTTVRPPLAGNNDSPGPALVDAMVAVLEGEPNRPILLAEDIYVRAFYLVAALAPEALERLVADQEGGPGGRAA